MGGKEGVLGEGGDMAQTLYAHMNKKKRKSSQIQLKQELWSTY
jgi:hypothetical protein